MDFSLAAVSSADFLTYASCVFCTSFTQGRPLTPPKELLPAAF